MKIRAVKGIGAGLLLLAAPSGPCQDTIPPAIVSVGSLNGVTISVCFDELVDPVTATNPANYIMRDPLGLAITSVVLRPEGTAVELTPATPLPGMYFNLRVTNVQDLAGNVITNRPVGGAVAYLISADLPQPGVDPVEPGSVWTCGRYDWRVVAGGSGLGTNSDGFHFLFEQRTGFFQVIARIYCLEPVNRWSQAGLMLRESLSPDSRFLSVTVTPPDVPTLDGSGNGANSFIASYRAVTGGPVIDWPGSLRILGVEFSKAGVRLTRNGQEFTASCTTNGTRDWFVMGKLTNTFPDTVFVGLATTSANNAPGFFTVADYGYGREGIVSTPAPRLHTRSETTSIVLSWLTAAGYRLESTDRLGAPRTWLQVTNPISVANGSNSVRIDPRGTADAFFRLTRP